MSNNPFLKSNETSKHLNNRFSFLDDEDTPKKLSFKESSNNSNRKNIEYESLRNSFSQPQSDRNRDRESYRPYNTFRPRHLEPPPPPKQIDGKDTALFPELISNKYTENTKNIEVSTKFKDILANVIEDDKPKSNIIPLGWTRLSLANRKTVIEHGRPTYWMIKQQKQEQLEKNQEDDSYYIMTKTVEAMKKNWARYEREYDEINGEHSYAERFRLPSIYGYEYDSESEDEYTDDYTDEDYMYNN